jgi:hypothetical protein
MYVDETCNAISFALLAGTGLLSDPDRHLRLDRYLRTADLSRAPEAPDTRNVSGASDPFKDFWR